MPAENIGKELLEIGGWLLIDTKEIVAVNKRGKTTYIFVHGIEDAITVETTDWEKVEKYFRIWC